MEHGLWITDHRSWIMEYGTWKMEHGTLKSLDGLLFSLFVFVLLALEDLLVLSGEDSLPSVKDSCTLSRFVSDPL